MDTPAPTPRKQARKLLEEIVELIPPELGDPEYVPF